MRSHHAIRRPRLLALMLSGLLAVSMAGWQGGSAQAADPVDTVTTFELSPAAVEYGDTVRITANVTQAGGGDVPVGLVELDAAPTQESLWGGEVVDVEFAQLLVEDAGAGVELTLDEDSLPFLSEDVAGFWMSAQYVPAYGGESWEDQFNASLGTPVYVDLSGEGPVATTTAVEGPESVKVDTPTTLTASVSPRRAPGAVAFSIDGVPVGGPVPVEGGVATLAHTFSSTGVSTVQATFTPTNPAAFTGSSDSVDVNVVEGAGGTTTEVTGPDTAKVGEEASLTATVLPAEAAGTVTFYVNGAEAATVDVDAGAASTSYTFESEGESTVAAAFEPADAATYQSSGSSARTVDVQPGTTSESEPEWWDAPIIGDSGCSKVGRAPGEGTVLRQAGPFPFFIPGILFNVQTLIWNGLSFIQQTIQAVANVIAMTFKVGPFAACKTEDGRHRVAATETTTVQCVLTDAGYWCPIGIPAGSRVAMEGSLPIPAGFAGKLVKFETTMSSVDPVTGELTTVGSGTTRVHVPKRTVLSARLAPAKASLTSVHPGKIVSYRVQVANKGVVTADAVRTCVSLGKGAEVLIAKGAKVHGRRACWTLPSLKKGQTVTRTLTLMAPRKTGPLKIVGTVTPKKSQADSLRLTTVLPVK